ncbi:hypothetical protein TcWFU_006067 [Taenia crassiceps]|uniref:Uncharacterized protein n=1 Tax=Taenia crassiceps TaxID=6207 RepID=A0ABR4QHJ8_9CEST
MQQFELAVIRVSFLFLFIDPETATLVSSDATLAMSSRMIYVDQYYNFRLSDITVTDPEKHPYMKLLYQRLNCPNASRKEATLGKQQQQQQTA